MNAYIDRTSRRLASVLIVSGWDKGRDIVDDDGLGGGDDWLQSVEDLTISRSAVR